MNSEIGDTLARDWNAIRHPGQHAANPQETPMTGRITDAKNAIDHAAKQLASLGSNALAEAIADEGAGQSFGPPEISLVLAVIHGIEHGPGGQLIASEQQRPAQQQTPAAQVQPQQQA